MANNQENNNNEQLPVTEESLSEALGHINSVTNLDGSLNLEALKDSPDALQALALIVGNSRNLGTISGDVNVVGQANTIVNIVLNNPTQVEKALGKDAYNSIVNAPAATGNAEVENATPKKRRKKTQEKDINVPISIGLTEGEFNLAAFLRENTELSNEQIADYCKDTKNPTKLFRNRKLKKLAEKINNLPETIAQKHNESLFSTSISKEDILRHTQRVSLAEDIKVLTIAKVTNEILLNTANKYVESPVKSTTKNQVEKIVDNLIAKDPEYGKASITEPLYQQYQEDKRALEWEILREVPKKMIKPDALSETKMNQLTKDQSSRFKYRLIAVMLTVVTITTLALNQISYKKGFEAGETDDFRIFETIQSETPEQNKDAEQENENNVDQAPEQDTNETETENTETEDTEKTQEKQAIAKLQSAIVNKLDSNTNAKAKSFKVGYNEIAVTLSDGKVLTIALSNTNALNGLSGTQYYEELAKQVETSKDYICQDVQEKSYKETANISQSTILQKIIKEKVSSEEYNNLASIETEDSTVSIHENGNTVTLKTTVADKVIEIEYLLKTQSVLTSEQKVQAIKNLVEKGLQSKGVVVSEQDVNIYPTVETTIGQ